MDDESAEDAGFWDTGEEAAAGTLYMVAVPIGNLGDLSARALTILSKVDLIACEEVQSAKRLCSSQGFSAHLISYRESGRDSAGERIVQELIRGRSVAYVSGAGTPGISDPGRDLAERCHQQGLRIVPVPGPSALTAAVSCAGLPCRRFVFEGFLPRNDGERRRYLEELVSEERTLVFYEAPHRMLAAVTDMLEVFGNRRVFLGRELTKKFEQCWQTDLSALLAHLQNNEARGECVLVVAGCAMAEDKKQADAESEAQEDLEFLAGFDLGAKVCAELISHFRRLPRNYAKRLTLNYFK